MKKMFNKFMWISLGFSVMFLIMGIVLLVYPSVSLKVIANFVSVLMLVCGALLVLDYKSRILLTSFVSFGVLLIVMGIVLLFHPNVVITLIPIMVGIYIITNAVVSIQISLELRRYNSSYMGVLLLSILSLVCGFCMIAYPQSGAVALALYLGIALVVYSVSALINLFIFKRNVDNIVKLLK